ncbi:hypothetical protein GFO_1233 [Christiangramia forsetii KT0803]|uniref:Uncharacterized protein n=1 Tax=Christiangramia forsetii (strain DSM 17595 / CGMCC 1.15422 / KT0803) TaxID=411154 RepID=A0M0R2_CHRFK|nr:hypothetical protein GFO_1233 [Christiangramia forsetii KT0803]|tara:strand:+ start:231 stop:530 length:300 start_codon:yes stop_codon:yes gene_type:complete
MIYLNYSNLNKEAQKRLLKNSKRDVELNLVMILEDMQKNMVSILNGLSKRKRYEICIITPMFLISEFDQIELQTSLKYQRCFFYALKISFSKKTLSLKG